MISGGKILTVDDEVSLARIPLAIIFSQTYLALTPNLVSI